MPRKPKDLSVFHGHHVVSGKELRSHFPPEDPTVVDRPRMWRHVRHGIVIFLLAALVLGATGTAIAILTGLIRLPQAQETRSLAECPTGTYDYLPPEQVTVNVFNAAGREGLARQVADQLMERKFTVQAVGNKRYPTEVTAVIRGGFAGEPAVFTLQRNVPGSVFVRDDRGDASVDLILGPAYGALTDPGLVDHTPGTITCAVPTLPATAPVG
ncbi:LytR C-terminal domain-containing protein [Sinomonas mesophila]|uniref:LytR C-terminal domain-containing protein n=1 Tax=Sinomonas mesophila TaxID=1531955 RepID=UPI000985192C|nr:LytR C-terminal domain-containing protein [Sinomonas mesophila]